MSWQLIGPRSGANWSSARTDYPTFMDLRIDMPHMSSTVQVDGAWAWLSVV